MSTTTITALVPSTPSTPMATHRGHFGTLSNGSNSYSIKLFTEYNADSEWLMRTISDNLAYIQRTFDQKKRGVMDVGAISRTRHKLSYVQDLYRGYVDNPTESNPIPDLQETINKHEKLVNEMNQPTQSSAKYYIDANSEITYHKPDHSGLLPYANFHLSEYYKTISVSITGITATRFRCKNTKSTKTNEEPENCDLISLTKPDFQLLYEKGAVKDLSLWDPIAPICFKWEYGFWPIGENSRESMSIRIKAQRKKAEEAASDFSKNFKELGYADFEFFSDPDKMKAAGFSELQCSTQHFFVFYHKKSTDQENFLSDSKSKKKTG
jgi:hypothetical protein